jgi:hypothetical protein
MEHKKYNGWANYETWGVALWMDNERGSHDYWLSVAAGLSSPDSPEYIVDENTQKRRLADRLKDEHEESLPELQGFAADLLNAAMSQVDWYDIAEDLIHAANEDREYEAKKSRG